MVSWKENMFFGSFNITVQFWFLPFDAKVFEKTQFNPILTVVDNVGIAINSKFYSTELLLGGKLCKFMTYVKCSHSNKSF